MDAAVNPQRMKTIKFLCIVDFSLSKQGIFFITLTQKAVCTVSRYKRLFCLGVPRIRTARPRRSGVQSNPPFCVKIVAIM